MHPLILPCELNRIGSISFITYLSHGVSLHMCELYHTWDLRETSQILWISLHRFELVYYSDVSTRERSYVFSSPRIRRADIEVPNSAVDMDSRAELACYPRGSFYLMSFGLFLIRAIGSLSSAFATARHIRLAVKPAFAFTRPGRFPSALSRP